MCKGILGKAAKHTVAVPTSLSTPNGPPNGIDHRFTDNAQNDEGDTGNNQAADSAHEVIMPLPIFWASPDEVINGTPTYKTAIVEIPPPTMANSLEREAKIVVISSKKPAPATLRRGEPPRDYSTLQVLRRDTYNQQLALSVGF